MDGFEQRAKKLGLSNIAFWQCALESLVAERRVSASVLLTRLTAFHFLVNGEAPSNVRPAATVIPVNSQKLAGHGFTRLRSIGAPSARANYLTRQQVAQIYHVGSFLPQHYGTLFNVRISIHHGKLGVHRHDDAVALASALTHAIRLKLEYRLPPNVNGFHWSHVHERDQEGGLVTRMAAYIYPNHIEEIVTWVRHRFFAKRFPQAPANALSVARVRRESLDARLQFHWSSVRAQMRGLDPTVLERSASNGLTPLVELLGIPRRLRAATGGVECRKVFGTSESLGPTARRGAAQMKFLSAFNDRAWSSLYIGWEIREYADRNLERKRRLDEENKIRAMFAGGSELANVRRTDAQKAACFLSDKSSPSTADVERLLESPASAISALSVDQKTKGEVRLDDNETRISGAWRADVTGVGAWEPSCRGFGIVKILKNWQLHTAKAVIR